MRIFSRAYFLCFPFLCTLILFNFSPYLDTVFLFSKTFLPVLVYVDLSIGISFNDPR